MDVQRLARFARMGRVIAQGLILLDGGIRSQKVHQAWREGSPEWKRMAFVEGGSFAGGVLLGAAIGMVIAITPVGLVFGNIAGRAAAGVENFLKNF